MTFGKIAVLFVFAVVIGLFAVPINAQDATAEAKPECAVHKVVQTDPAGKAAYAAIAIYPGVDEAKRGEFVQKVNEGFVPILEASEGFIGYIMADLGKDGWIAIRMFETEEGAAASAAAAKDWVAANIADLLPEEPTRYAGRVDLRALNLCVGDAGITTMVQTDPAGSANYVAIARYTGVDETKRSELVQHSIEGFVPIMEASDGFIGYFMADLGKDGWIAIRMFETEEQAAASAAAATTFVAANVADLLPEEPTRYAGRVDLRAFNVAAADADS